LRPTAVRVARNVAWLGFGEVALKGALFFAGVVVARGLGPEGMGVFTVAYAAALVLMQVLAGGQVEVLIRETARYPEHCRTLFVLARSHQLRLAVLVLPVAAIGAALVPRPALRWSLLAFIPYAFSRCWLITTGALFKGLDRMDVEVCGRALELLVALPLLTVVSLRHLPVWCTGVAFSVGGLAGLAWMVTRLHRLPQSAGAPLSRSTLVTEGLPFLGNTILGQLVMRSDNFLLASLGTPPATIGHYGVGSAPAQGLAAAAQVVAVASYPTLARWAAAGRLRPRVVLLLAAAGASLGTALGSLLFVLREPIVRIFFGPSFADSTRLLAVLAWGLPGSCTSTLAGSVIAAMRRQRWSLVSQSTLLLLSVTANLVAIPRYGAVGCAAVTVGVATLAAFAQTGIAFGAAWHGPTVTADERAYLALSEGQG
jgi:O-antigen/teichoic acid export membrane protein